MKYTDSHEWIETKDGIGTIGVSDHAQRELGDIVYVELPQVGKAVTAGQEAAVLESTKAAADVYSPVSGSIVEVNTNLSNDSGLVNQSPESKGWIFKVKLSAPQEVDSLMDKEAYQKKIGGGQ